MVEDCEGYITEFSKQLKKVQSLEPYLNFQPIIDTKKKFHELKKIETSHIKQLIKSDENSKEIE